MNRIKELREGQGWLQRDLEQKLNLGRGNISKYEKEDRSLSPELIGKLCDTFGVTADYLLGRSNTPTVYLTDEEAELLRAYRAASEDAKAVINLTLKPYMGNADRKDAVS